MIQCFLNQTYPREKMEWIIVDDGTDKVEDIIKAANIPQITYIYLPKKVSLGEKRNITHKHATGSIIVYMDDDDYYPPERVSHAVETLQANPQALCAGSSEMYVYFKHINKMYQSGPFGPNHATAASFAFRKELLNETRYNDAAALAEEKVFLKDYTVPFAQLDPLKTILVFSHEQNSFDKKTLLAHGDNPVFKESNKTVPMFIRTRAEKPIMEFFLKDIDNLLKNYSPGNPENKPDVLKQLKEIAAERANMIQNQGNVPKIMIQRPGEPPAELSLEQIVQLLQQQQEHINQLTKTIQDQANTIEELTNKTPIIAKISGREAVGDRENSGERSSKEFPDKPTGLSQKNTADLDVSIAKISGREAVGDRENSGERSSKEFTEPPANLQPSISNIHRFSKTEPEVHVSIN
jgi:hypothetical protein